MPDPGSALVAGIGMVTPAGCGADASCAAIRAGITRFAEMPSVLIAGDDGSQRPLVGSAVTGVTDGTHGLGRFTRLAADAIADLAENAGLADGGLASAGFYIALPPADRPAVDPRLGGDLGARIERFCQIKGAAARTAVFQGGHAAFVEAVAAAIADLARGAVGAAVVGGVDSLVEPETARHFHAAGRLKTPDTPVGFIPGEGAAFLLLEAPARLRSRGGAALCAIESPATATERITVASSDPCDGAGLAAAIDRAIRAIPDRGADAGALLTDLNGEPYRAEELAYAVVRSLGHVKAQVRLFHAADCIGDAGAASAAIAACAGARAIHRGYARTDRMILTASSDGGLRGALSLRAEKGR